MELELVKKFLRIDLDDDDELLKLFMDTAEEFIINAVGECDYGKARVKVVALNYILSLYQNRAYSETERETKASHTCKSLLTQLRLEYGE